MVLIKFLGAAFGALLATLFWRSWQRRKLEQEKDRAYMKRIEQDRNPPE